MLSNITIKTNYDKHDLNYSDEMMRNFVIFESLVMHQPLCFPWYELWIGYKHTCLYKKHCSATSI